MVRHLIPALALAAACSGEGGRAGDGVWELNIDSTAAGAGRTAWLRTAGQEGPEGQPSTDEVILSFDCTADHTGATILTRQALRQGSVEAEVTADAEPPHAIPGFAGTTPTGGQVVLTIPLDSVFALLTGHQRATIHYADGAGSSRTTAVFTVSGLERHREAFLASCARDDTPR